MSRYALLARGSHILRAGIASGSLLFAACAIIPPDGGTASVRHNLESLEADPKLNIKGNAPHELEIAEQAIAAAEAPQVSTEEAAHQTFIAGERVQIAAWTAAANRDQAGYAVLAARRDAMRHGSSDSVITLATDPFGATPQPLQFTPIGAGVPANAAATGVQGAVTQPPPGAPEKPAIADTSGPLLALAANAFTGGAALSTAAHGALDRLVPQLLQQAQRPVLIYFGEISDTNLLRASSVKVYLVAHGVASQRLFIAASNDSRLMIPAGGVSIQYEQGSPEVARP